MLINLNGDVIVDTDSVAAFSKGDDVTYIEKHDRDYDFSDDDKYREEHVYSIIVILKNVSNYANYLDEYHSTDFSPTITAVYNSKADRDAAFAKLENILKVVRL